LRIFTVAGRLITMFLGGSLYYVSWAAMVVLPPAWRRADQNQRRQSHREAQRDGVADTVDWLVAVELAHVHPMTHLDIVEMAIYNGSRAEPNRKAMG